MATEVSAISFCSFARSNQTHVGLLVKLAIDKCMVSFYSFSFCLSWSLLTRAFIIQLRCVLLSLWSFHALFSPCLGQGERQHVSFLCPGSLRKCNYSFSMLLPITCKNLLIIQCELIKQKSRLTTLIHFNLAFTGVLFFSSYLLNLKVDNFTL